MYSIVLCTFIEYYSVGVLCFSSFKQLLISYVDLLDTKQARLNSLAHTYGFKCLCARCQPESSNQVKFL